MENLRSIGPDGRNRGLEDPGGSPVATGELLASTARLIATGLGILTIIIGLYLSTNVFLAVHEILTEPQGFRAFYQQWVDVLGGEKIAVKLQETQLPMANMMATSILVTGSFLLAWIALAIMLTGAKIVSWTSSEQEAIKRILKYALGSNKPAK